MDIIKPHDVTLYGSAGGYGIILRPMRDDDLPLLCQWNADPEVLYWSDGSNARAHDTETVHNIYGKSSQTGFCFIVEVNGSPVGECWLCKMNYKYILERHPDAADIRRIDMAIGEKSYWNRGIGTALVGMLVDFAFNGEYADVLYGMVFDFNDRSRRVFEKNGFQLSWREPSTDPDAKVKEELFLRLARAEYIERRRINIPPEKTFELPCDGMSELWDILDINGYKTGRVIERGQPMFEGEYHLAVHVWIYNRKGEWLISKRSPEKKASPNIWEACGGAAAAGEDSLTAALRETREELGLTLDPDKGILFKAILHKNQHPPGGSCRADVWIFSHDCPIGDIILQPGETCDARWENADAIRAMIASGSFVNATYFDELVASINIS